MTPGMITDSVRCTALVRSVLAALVIVALLVTLAVAPAAAAAKGCSVKDEATGRTYGTLQAAVRAAKPKTTLLLRGTCVGRTVVRKSLTITGVRTGRSGEPMLSGADRVRVLKISTGARVKLQDLAVVRGRAAVGAGIHNRGRLVLANVQVRQNRAVPFGLGGGIRNFGTVLVNRASRISANYGRVSGGVENHGTFVLNGTSVIGANRGHHVAGVRNFGTFVANGSSVIANNRTTLPPRGSGDRSLSPDASGGVLNSFGTFTMNDDSSIRGNRRPSGEFGGGGGVTNSGTFTMNDRSSITINAGGRAGGVDNRSGTFTMNDDSSIRGNQGGVAGGVYNYAELLMSGHSSVRGNSGGVVGGIDLHPSSPLRLTGDSSVTGNTGASAGGIRGDGSDLSGVTCGPGGNVYGNTPDDCYFGE